MLLRLLPAQQDAAADAAGQRNMTLQLLLLA